MSGYVDRDRQLCLIMLRLSEIEPGTVCLDTSCASAEVVPHMANDGGPHPRPPALTPVEPSKVRRWREIVIRFMLDTDMPDADLPPSPLFATYADLVPTTAAFGDLRARRPGSVIVLIDRGLGDPLGSASVCDIEPKAIWPPTKFGPWLDRKEKAGVPMLTSYCDLNDLPAVDAAAPGRSFYRWVAWFGHFFIPGFTPGREPAAIQFANSDMLGFHADGSLVFEAGWHPQPERRLVAGVVELTFSDGLVKTTLKV